MMGPLLSLMVPVLVSEDTGLLALFILLTIRRLTAHPTVQLTAQLDFFILLEENTTLLSFFFGLFRTN
jgi:hypothetical protein